MQFEKEPNDDRDVLLGNKNAKYARWGTKRNACSKTLPDSACSFCGRIIQLDNWEIKDDYPW